MSSRLRIAANLLWREAIRAVTRHRLRSALTALGIAIGTAAVVCVVAIGRAGSLAAQAQLANLGDNFVWVEAGSRNLAGLRTGTRGTTSLTYADLEAILREVPLIKSCSPQADGNVQVIHGNRNWVTHYRGVSPEFFTVRRWRIAAGAPFTDEDVRETAPVCLLGQTAREQLFGPDDPVGEVIQVGTQLFRVVGLLAPKGQTGSGHDQDDTLILPHTTAQRRIRGKGFTYLDDILCSAVSAQAVNPAIDRIIPLMRQRHGILPGGEDDFNIRRPDEVIKAQIEASRTMELLLISIAAIALVVGGIGIMNVMLVSVTERTPEIGLRLAVGATEADVRVQFLGEAVLLSLFGGLVGIVLGVGSAIALGRVLDWPMSVPPQAIVLSPVVATAVGVFFGFYPAHRAARLDPIAALRNE